MTTRYPGCPAAQALEAFAAGESEPCVEAHLPRCLSCSSQLETLRQACAAFVSHRPTTPFLKSLAAKPARGHWTWLGVAGFSLSMAGLLMLAVSPTDGVRLKGRAFQVLYKRGAAGPLPVDRDMVLWPGDALRFRFSATPQRYVAVLDRDGTGAVTVFHPYGGDRSVPLPAAEGGLLPGSITLDAAPGAEWLVGIASAESLDLRALAAQLKALPEEEIERFQCDGCAVEVLRVQKQP
jgi:Domain of unknown function (DUF4384)